MTYAGDMNADTVIVITGAKTGIGLELVKQAAKKGARIIAGVRGAAGARELLSAIGPRGDVLELDVTSDSSVRAFADQLRTRAKCIDVLINNAGIYRDGSASIETIDSSMILESFDANAAGPVRVTQSLLPFLRAAQAPKVITVTSAMGSLSDNKSGGAYAYRMSKAAANMFVRNFAVDEREITSVAVHPGWVKTKMGGAGAPLEPAKSAEGLWTVIESITPSDSGKFFNHAGRELPW